MRVLRTCVVAAATAIAAAEVCRAVEPPIPEFYGVYAVADGTLYSLDSPDPSLTARYAPVRISRTEKDFNAGGGPSVDVPVLPGSLNFLVFVKGNALQAASQLSLRQLPFVRTMTINANDRNWRRTYGLSTWVATTEFGYANVGAITVELRFKPVKGQDEMVMAVPVAPLTPGLYRLEGDFIFAVAPLESAAASRCIDATNGAAMGPWQTVPCAEAQAVASPVAPPTGASLPVSAVPSQVERRVGCDQGQASSVVSSPQDIRGSWIGELQQGLDRYSVQIELETGEGGLLSGAINYPDLHCSGTLGGTVNVTGETVGASVTETIRVADRLKCVSGSKVKIASLPDASGLLTQWFSRKGTVVASGTLCRPQTDAPQPTTQLTPPPQERP